MEEVDLKLGGVIAGRYTLQKYFAEGSQGKVWIASESLGAEPHPLVAIKVFRPPTLDGAWAEIRSLATVQHPNVIAYRCAVQVRDRVTGEDAVCLVMERADETAEEWAARSRGPPRFEVELTDLAFGWAEALRECHERMPMILHKDIKPKNLFVVRGRVGKVGDFGISRWTSNVQTKATRSWTYEYAAPEILNERPFGAPADIYALGATLHELWTGRLPYDVSAAAMGARFGGEVNVDAGLPPAWQDALRALLALRPEDRWTAAAFAAWLARQRDARRVAPLKAEVESLRAALSAAESELARVREASAEAARAHKAVAEDLLAQLKAAVALRKAAASTEAKLRAQVAALSIKPSDFFPAEARREELIVTERFVPEPNLEREPDARSPGHRAIVVPKLPSWAPDATGWADAVEQDAWGVCAIVRFLMAPAGHRIVDLRFRWAPPGRFTMGSPETEVGRDDDEHQHEIVIDAGFWIADTPVTQALWAAVMGTRPSKFTGDDRPVEQVSWDDAQGFLARLAVLRPGFGAVLPTEAQWEYACRAGTTTATYAGDPTLDSRKNVAPELNAIAWYRANSGRETQAVRTKRANAWGLYDTLGNVWEWCADSAEGERRGLRGGSWGDDARFVRAARRYAVPPGDRFPHFGFRLSRGQVRPVGPEGHP